MAITATGTIQDSAATLPTGYVAPTLPTINIEASGTYSVDVAISAANAVPSVGVANVIALVETQFEATFAASIGLDAAATINANVTIVTLTRFNDISVFSSGAEFYRCACKYDYEKV